MEHNSYIQQKDNIFRGLSKIDNVFREWICIYIAADWNLEPDFGNLPYPEKVTGTNQLRFGVKLIKFMIFLRFAKLFTVIRT